ncbi:hypothetical protein FRC12_010981 [Ceratobasidium sp. 428]|nr:hypothetical protein FRC12_010981 [Ceratobasidium sp. 428]
MSSSSIIRCISSPQLHLQHSARLLKHIFLSDIMSAPTYIVQSGDVLLVPEQGLTQLTIEWQQSLQNKKGDYLTGFVPVKGKGQNDVVLIFIQSDWYNTGHINKVDGHYELKVDDKTRYGQKNAKGEARFIVYHDTSRNPFQHRFMNQALRQTALGIGQKVAQMMGVPSVMSDAVSSQIQALCGDPLRKF